MEGADAVKASKDAGQTLGTKAEPYGDPSQAIQGLLNQATEISKTKFVSGFLQDQAKQQRLAAEHLLKVVEDNVKARNVGGPKVHKP